MKSILWRFAALLFVAAASAAAGMSIVINTPANGTVVNPGQTVNVSVSVTGAAAGIETITVSGERDPTGDAVIGPFPYSPPTNSTTQSTYYVIPSDATPGEVLTLSASATGWADEPVYTSVDLIAASVGPANNNFSGKASISGLSGQASGTNTDATKETGEPYHGGNAGGKSVWWTWYCPASGTATIDTEGSSFDTLLGVYTGTAVASLTTVAGDNDSGAGSASLVTFACTAGTTYQIAVDGFGGASGNVTLNWDVELPAAASDWTLFE